MGLVNYSNRVLFRVLIFRVNPLSKLTVQHGILSAHRVRGSGQGNENESSPIRVSPTPFRRILIYHPHIELISHAGDYGISSLDFTVQYESLPIPICTDHQELGSQRRFPALSRAEFCDVLAGAVFLTEVPDKFLSGNDVN